MSCVALITGASSGIGEATARRLAREPQTRLVLVARRGERLHALAAELAGLPGGAGAIVLAEDLTDPGAPDRIAEAVAAAHGALHLLVNNAGASWRGAFAEGGWDDVARHLAVDFEAPVRLTEALLPLLHATARGAPPATGDAPRRRVAVVNVSSTAVWAGRPRAGAYGAAKAALLAWSESLRAEEAPRGVHVGVVMPGFVATEGFPQSELRARALTRRLVATPEVVAEAILDAGPGGRAERYAPRWYGGLAAVRLLAPGLIRRAVGGGAFTPEASPGK